MATSNPRVEYSKDQHDKQADRYGDFEQAPHGIFEHQLHDSALGDCTGITVLDLGGGQGLRARQVVDHGAIAVDVVDLSPEMMRVGQKIEEALGRGDKVLRWFEADVSKPDELARLPLRFKEEGYDMVMANWLFDHAGNMEKLDGMFRSVVAYLKPGGRFIGTRAFNTPRAPAATSGKYGFIYKDFEDIPGGMAYRYILHVDPPVQYDTASMEATYNPAKVDELHAKYGLEDTQIEPYENSSLVRSDPDYWRLFLDQPSMAIVKARKKLN
ncbi:Sarcosine/dimethylglycine N-methyltransferase [Cytospora mali]|uniref:Sarcosine/dimethylglycine N-methyltransferase n=1 Tax=Cytospora mali TaxID=578113 RepID=A0A194WA63_CYTMA|nr:Sarcosine/dimethylglycine N-methyltransferase [Valsa mali]